MAEAGAERDSGAAVVGVGASAGGLAALRALFAEVAPTGASWVVVLHRLATPQGELARILQRDCPLPVREVESSQPLEPDVVYVAPGQRVVEVVEEELVLRDPSDDVQRRYPIDLLFRSIARADLAQKVGVVLTGAGNDGSIGLHEIEAVGGAGFVQRVRDAEHPDMPRAALEGSAATELPVERIPQAVADFLRHGAQALGARLRAEELEDVLNLILARARFDFQPYRRATLQRRLRRRMALAGEPEVSRYLKRLEEDSTELDRLVADLLIHVTTFFREPGAWQALREQAIEPLLGRGKPLRAWVVGCATGEEAYSLAMVLCEAMDAADRQVGVQIFATDVSKRAIEVARRGAYPESVATELDEERLARFFEPDGAGHRVGKRLRDMIVFAPQNVLGDPPFSQLDLVTCRNLLIYLDPSAQRRVIDTLRYALRPGGYLFLGSAEMVERDSGVFRAVVPQARIYQRADDAKGLDVPRAPVPTHPRYSPHAARTFGHRDFAALTQRHLLARYAPPAVTVDERMRALYFHGPTHELLRQPEGEPTRDLLEMAPVELRSSIRSVIDGAVRDGTCEIDAQLREGGGTRRLRLSAHRFAGTAHTDERVVVVAFEDRPAETAEIVVDSDAPPGELVKQLEAELHRTRADLQRTIEELERSNHELTSSNEEIMSMNEELQSTNEELQTSKEELVSVNEELVTVNSTLEEKVYELERTTDDLGNLLRSTELATLFLDDDLRIRRFTPAATRVLRLIESDLGRSVLDLAGTVDVHAIEEDAERVLNDQEMVIAEEVATDGTPYVRRVLPYRTEEGRLQGVVVTYSDISEIRRAEAQLERQALEAKLILRATRIVSEGRSFQESLSGCLDVACELMGWPIGHIYLPSDDGRSMRPTGIWHLDDEEERSVLVQVTSQMSFDRGAGLPGEILATGEPVLIPDVQADPGFIRASQGVDIRVRGALGFPIVLKDEVVAVLEMFDDRPAQRDDKLLDLLRAVGAQIGRAVERRRSAEALRESEARLREQARRLEEASRHKNEFLALLGHELRNPLAPIRHSAALLRDSMGSVDPEIRNLVEVIDRQSLQMARLVDDLLDVARITRGTVSLEREPLDLRDVVPEALETVVGFATERKQQIDVSVPDEPVPVLGDRVRLTQVVANLLGNAVKYTGDGGHIRLDVSTEEGAALIRVRDTGVGIDPERLPDVFQAFRQFGQSIDRARGGLGLGLTLVQSLVHAHGGQVYARSEGRDRGSEFEVSLPLHRAERAEQPSERSADEPLEQLPPLEILVCDDNEDAATTMAMLLRRRGHRVTTTHSGREAIEEAQRISPDVVFLDIGLPDMDGYEVARQLHDARGSMVLVAVTGYGQERDRALAAEAGFDRHLLKPVTSGLVDELLRDVVARR